MSQRSSWQPGGARPLQHTSPLPDPSYATAHLPTTPIRAVRREPREPVYREEEHYRDDYRDDYYEDDRYSSRRPRRRGQLFAGLVVVLALVAAALLYLLTYRMLASVDLGSADPFAGFASALLTLGAVVMGAAVVFVLALLAMLFARPKAIATLGLALSLLLPVAAVVIGLVHGGSVLQQHVEASIAQVGPAAAAQGAAVADTLLRELENRGVELGPLRDLIVGVVGRG